MRHAGQRGMVEPRLATGSLGARRRAWNPEHDQRVRSFFHDEAGRNRNRFGAQPANRRSPRRNADAGESPRHSGVRGAVAFAALGPLPPLFVTAHSKVVTGIFCVTEHSKGVSIWIQTNPGTDSERTRARAQRSLLVRTYFKGIYPVWGRQRVYTQEVLSPKVKKAKGKAAPISFFLRCIDAVRTLRRVYFGGS